MQKMLITNVMLAAMLTASGGAFEPYDVAALAKFRADRELVLKRDTGWLTVAGLHFLNQGDNRVGPIRPTISSSTFRAFRNTLVSSPWLAPTFASAPPKVRRC